MHCLQLLPEDVPGKSGGPPGNAFELVYISVTDAVRRAVRKVDPVLADWIRYPYSVSLNVTRPMPKCLVGVACSVTVMLDGTHLTGNSHCCWHLHVATPVCLASLLVHDDNILYLHGCSCANCVHFPF